MPYGNYFDMARRFGANRLVPRGTATPAFDAYGYDRQPMAWQPFVGRPMPGYMDDFIGATPGVVNDTPMRNPYLPAPEGMTPKAPHGSAGNPFGGGSGSVGTGYGGLPQSPGGTSNPGGGLTPGGAALPGGAGDSYPQVGGSYGGNVGAGYLPNPPVPWSGQPFQGWKMPSVPWDRVPVVGRLLGGTGIQQQQPTQQPQGSQHTIVVRREGGYAQPMQTAQSPTAVQQQPAQQSQASAYGPTRQSSAYSPQGYNPRRGY